MAAIDVDDSGHVKRPIRASFATATRRVIGPPNGLTLTGADRTRKEYRTRDNRGAVGVRWSVELGVAATISTCLPRDSPTGKSGSISCSQPWILQSFPSTLFWPPRGTEDHRLRGTDASCEWSFAGCDSGACG